MKWPVSYVPCLFTLISHNHAFDDTPSCSLTYHNFSAVVDVNTTLCGLARQDYSSEGVPSCGMLSGLTHNNINALGFLQGILRLGLLQQVVV